MGANKKTWRDHFEIHPACNMFPMMAEAELLELGKDIKAHGQIQPVVLFDGKLLDGRNRLAAMELVGIPPEDFRWLKIDAGVNPYDYVVGANIHRRHLNATQRKELLITLIAKHPERSNRRIGKAAGVDGKTVAAARAEGEKVGRIPHQKKVVGIGGKKQKAKKTITKPKSKAKVKPAPWTTS